MKRIIITIVLAVLCTSLFFSCGKDKLGDNLYDQTFFAPYDGQDFKFLNVSFVNEADAEGWYTCRYHLITYLPEWPEGTVRFYYKNGGEYNEEDYYECGHTGPEIASLMYGYTFKFKNPLAPSNKYMQFKPCYITADGTEYFGEEKSFVGY